METENNEYYVSLEVAKLLKKAGFDWECRMIHFCYIEDDHMWNLEDNHKQAKHILKLDYCLLAPTLEVAQRWLREVKGMCLTIQPLFDKVNGQFNVVVGFTPFIHRMDGEMIIVSLDSEHTYEEAQEAGIKKALEIILEEGE